MSKNKKNKTGTIEEFLSLAAGYEFEMNKTVHLDTGIHNKLKHIATDHSFAGLTVQRLANAVLFKWIENYDGKDQK